MQQKLTVRVRLILLCADQVLVAYHSPTKTYFMPGGGLEHGESSIACLRREMNEECDIKLPDELIPFGVLENRFIENNTDIHEILIHFGARIQATAPPIVNSRELDLEFSWIAISSIAETEIWPPETYDAIRSAYLKLTAFHYAPLERRL
jgi:8-oxo-dGTP pyrophosphatase MutT (NUDIX family)